MVSCEGMYSHDSCICCYGGVKLSCYGMDLVNNQNVAIFPKATVSKKDITLHDTK